jgi:hypothetical protein
MFPKYIKNIIIKTYFKNCNINIIFDMKTWKKKTLVTVPMAPIFVNVTPNKKFKPYCYYKGFYSMGEKSLRCTTHNKKGLLLIAVIFYPVFWSP